MGTIKYFTEEGLKKLKDELEHLSNVERPAISKQIAEAREKVYTNIPRIHFEGCHYRKDIALIKGD